MSSSGVIRIGTRGSKLARWQSDWVAERLQARGAQVEIIEISTRGDVQQHDTVASLETTGVFTKEIQSALLAGEVDLAVHSLKDLPTQPVEGLTLAAVPLRENLADALVTSAAALLTDLPPSAKIGTGSLRRRAQLLNVRPDFQVLPIRGNVDTRLKKLDDGEYDAIVLAAAGLIRLGVAERITEYLEPPRMLPAPGQGALAIECRADDAGSLAAAAGLDDAAARLATTAERTVLSALHGGCSAPIGAWGRFVNRQLHLDALVASVDGRRVLCAADSVDLATLSGVAAIAAAEELGRRVATELERQGAASLISESRGM
jgi:hydroxymethylbilane synthase